MHHFRNYEQLQLTFKEGVNVAIGDNAQGKTTLLESIYLFASGRSFLTSRIQELIRHGSSHFFVELHFSKYGVEQVLKFSCDGKQRRFWLNQTLLRSTTQLLGLLPMVKVGPEEQELVKGGPQARRRFLDLQLAQMDPLYVHHMGRYQEAIKQRNQLLKLQQFSLMDPWEYELVRSGIYMHQRRKRLIEALSSYLQQHHLDLGKVDVTLTLSYKASLSQDESLPSQEALIEMYRRTRKKDALLKRTSLGPHKDDLGIWIEEKDARHYSSEGQKRLIILALHFAAWSVLKEGSEGLSPLLLVDDALCGLDATRARHLLSSLEVLGAQSIVTSPQIPEEGRESMSVFHVSAGGVCRV